VAHRGTFPENPGYYQKFCGSRLDKNIFMLYFILLTEKNMKNFNSIRFSFFSSFAFYFRKRGGMLVAVK